MSDPKDCRKRKVFVIEQDPHACLVVASMLSSSGYRVSSTTLLPEPTTVADFAPDVVILGNVHGGREGTKNYLCELKSDPGTAGVPVLGCGELDRISVAPVAEKWLQEIVGLLSATRPTEQIPAIAADEPASLPNAGPLVQLLDKHAESLAHIG